MFNYQQSGMVINKTAQKRTLESEENLESKNKKYKKSELVQDNELNDEQNDINEIEDRNNEPVFFDETNLLDFNINHSKWLKQIIKENLNDV